MYDVRFRTLKSPIWRDIIKWVYKYSYHEDDLYPAMETEKKNNWCVETVFTA
jgi:hypothetical protein